MATITDILDKLLAQTNQGKIHWRKTAGKQTFLATFGDYSTLIAKNTPSYAMDSEFELRILDKRGDTIEQVTTPYVNPPAQLRNQLSLLHGEARRQALDIAIHLDNLSKAIDLAGRN